MPLIFSYWHVTVHILCVPLLCPFNYYFNYYSTLKFFGTFYSILCSLMFGRLTSQYPLLPSLSITYDLFWLLGEARKAHVAFTELVAGQRVPSRRTEIAFHFLSISTVFSIQLLLLTKVVNLASLGPCSVQLD